MPTTKTARSKKMERKRKLLEQYELPNITCSRWGLSENASRLDLLRGMLWTVFARFIRIRDNGSCISCNARKDFNQLQAGHYVPVGGSSLDLVFDEQNVNGECERCNAWDSFHLVPMKINMIIKYGNKVVKSLEQRKFAKTAVFWSESDYVEKIKYYYEQINKSQYGR